MNILHLISVIFFVLSVLLQFVLPDYRASALWFLVAAVLMYAWSMGLAVLK